MADINRSTISLAGQSLKSDAWVAMGRVLFGSVQIKRDQKISLIPPAARFFRYCCDTCDNRFESAVTPEKCPTCGALPGELGVTVTHHLRSNPAVTHTAKTFPFSLISVLLCCVILCSTCISCAAKPTHGTVVRTRYEAAWTQWIWVSHCCDGGGHLQPIFWPERHIVVITGLVPGTNKVFDEAEYSVDETTYHNLRPGDQFTAP